MASPVTSAQLKAAIADPTSSVCAQMISALLKFPLLVYQIFNWMLDVDGNFSDAFKTAISNFMIKPGDLIFSASPIDTDGRLLCNGQIVSRTTYAALYAKVATMYGVGDGATTFGLPDYRDRFPVGASVTKTLGVTGGQEEVIMDATQIAPHFHGTAGFGAVIGDDAEAQMIKRAWSGVTPALPTEMDTGDGGRTMSATPSISAGRYGTTDPIDSPSATPPTAVPTLPPWMACYIYIKT